MASRRQGFPISARQFAVGLAGYCCFINLYSPQAVLPPIFAVTIAYIGDEWPANEATGAAGVYTSGASLGGFSGRFFTGVLADIFGWRIGLISLAGATLIGAALVAFLLPREKKFVKSEGFGASLKQMLRHLRNPQLLATYAVGFGVLFNFISTFTYVSFQLANPPYNLSATWLGVVFFVYLTGVAVAPMTGRAIARFGRKRYMVAIIMLWIVGIWLTLAPPLPVIVLGLALCAGCGLICQTVSTGYVTVTAKTGRSSAVGLYVTSFYIGGSFGAAGGGIAWTFGGWGACAAMVSIMLLVMAAIVGLTWTARAPQKTAMPIEPPA